MAWSTKLINDWLEDPKAVERDIRLLGLLEDGADFVEPYKEVTVFGETYRMRNEGVLLHHTEEEVQDIIYNKTRPESIAEPKGEPHYLRAYQKEMLSMIQSNRFCVMPVARQIGTTSTLAVYVAHYLANNWEKSIMFLTKDVRGAARKILTSIACSPYYRQSGVKQYEQYPANRTQGEAVVIRFDNGCTIRVFDTDKLLVSPDLLVVDGVQEYGKELYQGIRTGLTMRSGTKIVITGQPDREGRFAEILDSVKDSVFEVRSWDYTVFWSEFSDVIKEQISTEAWLMEYELLIPGTQEWRDRMLEMLL